MLRLVLLYEEAGQGYCPGQDPEKIVEDVLTNNANVVEQFKGGNTKVKGFLVGQVMKLSKGKANPKMASDMIDAKLAE